MCCPLAIAAPTVATWGEPTRPAPTKGMRRATLRRIRWGNASLAVAVLIALATVVAWPLVSTSSPGLPPDTARPLVGEEGSAASRGGAPPRAGEAAGAKGDDPATGAEKAATKRGDTAPRGGEAARAKRRAAAKRRAREQAASRHAQERAARRRTREEAAKRRAREKAAARR